MKAGCDQARVNRGRFHGVRKECSKDRDSSAILCHKACFAPARTVSCLFSAVTTRMNDGDLREEQRTAQVERFWCCFFLYIRCLSHSKVLCVHACSMLRAPTHFPDI